MIVKVQADTGRCASEDDGSHHEEMNKLRKINFAEVNPRNVNPLIE